VQDGGYGGALARGHPVHSRLWLWITALWTPQDQTLKETLEIFEPDAIPKMSGHQITISGSLSCYGQIYFTQTLSGFSFANWNLQGQGQGALA